MPVLPCHCKEPGLPRLEERPSLGVNGNALLGADHEWTDAIPADAAFVWERVPVYQLHQPEELVGLSLVRSSRKKQKVGSRFGERGAQLVSRYLVRAAAHPMRLVDDDEV